MSHSQGSGSPDEPSTKQLSPDEAAQAVAAHRNEGPRGSDPAPRRKLKGPSLADMLIGTVLADRYRLLRRIGDGAMGWVFLAEHTEIGKKYAVKVLRPALCRIPEAIQRFRREARAASQIGSKHIVDVVDFGATPNGAAFMVMELLDGGEDLGSTLKKHGRLPWERVVDIIAQACDALQAAHDQDVIHRDVKPANMYRQQHEGKEDFVKVLDFGIARLATPQDSVVTATGVVMGTPDFMAPEQAQGRHVDHRADIYSLGASAYALVVGRPPFTGNNEYDVIYKQLNEQPKAPSAAAPNSEIPKWLDGVILRALAKDPAARFQSMREFAKALRQGPNASFETSATEPAPSRSPRGIVDTVPVPSRPASGPSAAPAGTASHPPIEKTHPAPSASSPAAVRPSASASQLDRVASASSSRITRPPAAPSSISPAVLALAALVLAGLGALGVWIARTIAG